MRPWLRGTALLSLHDSFPASIRLCCAAHHSNESPSTRTKCFCPNSYPGEFLRLDCWPALHTLRASPRTTKNPQPQKSPENPRISSTTKLPASFAFHPTPNGSPG